MSILEEVNTQLDGKVKQHVVLAPYSTFKIGGEAEYYFLAETKDELIKASKLTKELNIPFLLLAGASNIILPEGKIPGLVVRNLISYKKVIQDTPDFQILEVGSGYSMTRLAKETAELGLSGVEYHLGLPGTVGGAVVMNSKWTHPNSYVGDVVESTETLDTEGILHTRDASYCEFSYGYSKFQETKEIVLSVRFKLLKQDPATVLQHAKEAQEYRKKTQPYGVNTSGCFFKNIDGQSAGELIDKAGMKGVQIGDLVVSDIHANFIVNKGKGTVKDLKSLLSLIKEKVKNKFNVELKEEVVIM
jgi:UDP-N-acetylmuramate dehydrogenase